MMTWGMKHIALLSCVALLVPTSGCSFFATQSPRPPPEPPSCTVSRGPVALDALIATTSMFTAVGFGIASATTRNKEREEQYATTAGLLMLPSITALASTLVGTYRTHRCRKATEAWEVTQRMQRMQYPYPPQPYPQQPYPQQPYPQQPYPQQPYPPQPPPQQPSPPPLPPAPGQPPPSGP